MSTKQAEEKKIEAQLQKFDAQIEEMKAKASQAKADAQVQYYEQIENLKQQRQQTGQKLEEFKASSENAWKEIKLGLDEAMGSLQTSFERASSHFN